MVFGKAAVMVGNSIPNGFQMALYGIFCGVEVSTANSFYQIVVLFVKYCQVPILPKAYPVKSRQRLPNGVPDFRQAGHTRKLHNLGVQILVCNIEGGIILGFDNL